MLVKCWTHTFTNWFAGFGIIVSLFFGLGIPFTLGFYMYLYKDDLQDLDRQNSGGQTRGLISNSISGQVKKVDSKQL